MFSPGSAADLSTCCRPGSRHLSTSCRAWSRHCGQFFAELHRLPAGEAKAWSGSCRWQPAVGEVGRHSVPATKLVQLDSSFCQQHLIGYGLYRQSRRLPAGLGGRRASTAGLHCQAAHPLECACSAPTARSVKTRTCTAEQYSASAAEGRHAGTCSSGVCCAAPEWSGPGCSAGPSAAPKQVNLDQMGRRLHLSRGLLLLLGQGAMHGHAWQGCRQCHRGSSLSMG